MEPAVYGRQSRGIEVRVVVEGKVRAENDFEHLQDHIMPYGISYRAIVPRQHE